MIRFVFHEKIGYCTLSIFITGKMKEEDGKREGKSFFCGIYALFYDDDWLPTVLNHSTVQTVISKLKIVQIKSSYIFHILFSQIP